MSTISNLIPTTPSYEITLPSDGSKIEFRPFLVKEEKILLIASESKNEKEMVRAIQDVVSACTFGKLNMSSAPMVDIEYLFLKIRSKSVGESAKPTLKCKKCSKLNTLEINLDTIEAEKSPEHNKKIEISKNVIIEMRYPKFSDVELIQNVNTDAEKLVNMMAVCIEKIYTPENTFNTKELSTKEVIEFIDNLTQVQFRMLTKFFETMPQVTKKVDYKCKHCGSDESITLRGAQDFFS
jgi:hypothetical protein